MIHTKMPSLAKIELRPFVSNLQKKLNVLYVLLFIVNKTPTLLWIKAPLGR